MWLQAISLSLLAVSSHALTTTAAQRPVQALQRFLDDVTTTSAARVATEDGQLHLQLTKNIRRGDCVLEVPLDACVTIDRARAMPWLQTAEDNAGEPWDPWCGDASLLAACLLRDDLPREWIESLPQDLWLPLLDTNEPPSCSARDLGALRENAVDDMQWLVDNTGENWDDFLLALAWVISRSVEVPDVGLCLAPGLDLVDHDDLLDPFEEDLLCELGPRGPGGIQLPGRKTVRFLAPEDRTKGEKLVASYGALPAAAYLERYGFLPRTGAARRFAATAELRFELREEDRFIDDKLNLLYLNGAIDGEEVDDGFVEACLGGEPDPEVLRFLRLSLLEGPDAFLLEPIFANEVWNHLGAPISRDNEAAVIKAVADEAEAARQGMLVATIGIYEQLRSAELDALEATQRWADAEVLTLPAKEYYQERRLKSLGLDTEWDEDEGNQWTGSRGAAW
uniref:Rubisco LSMT substrate-binding domain-containing protein n=2 Tax=Pelagomonas calceolata TaxID=35677 RepID=A0A7S4EDY2_9STRA|mmetsp:Transcript_17805/g.55191  ORF Transcript_17805/g.55191 Transcript_17805/m.55191 type:complete len:452 (+) Transcript_17805:170-1525(+)